jgi:hypothetical protein
MQAAVRMGTESETEAETGMVVETRMYLETKEATKSFKSQTIQKKRRYLQVLKPERTEHSNGMAEKHSGVVEEHHEEVEVSARISRYSREVRGYRWGV